MAKSNIRKSEMIIRAAGTDTKAGGQRSRIALNKEGLLAEHRVSVSVSQANSGTDPTSCDVRRFIKNIELQVTGGKRFACSGHMAYDLHRLTEGIAAPVTSLGATSTAVFSFELHHEMDGALYDMLTAIRGSDMAMLDLVIDWADDADNGFIGQTSPAAASYTVSVVEKSFPGMLALPGVGSLKQFVEEQAIPGTTTGRQADVRLSGDNSTRFITIHAFDTTTGVAVPSDAVLDSVKVVVNGLEKRVMSWREIREETGSGREVDEPGFGALDWGDDEAGFLDLMGVNDPRLQYVVAAGAPASWRVDIGQVSIKR